MIGESNLDRLIRERRELIDPYWIDAEAPPELPEDIEEKAERLEKEILAEMRLMSTKD